MTSPQPQQDWQSRLRDLKTNLNAAKQSINDRSSSVGADLNEVDVDLPGLGLDSLQRGYRQSIDWFNSIPSSGKLLAIAGGGLLSLTLIKTVFQLISSLITLSVFGIILYLVYRFWILPKSSDM
jgi:hypothetical protein